MTTDDLPEASFGERVPDACYVVRPGAYGVIVQDSAVLLVQGASGRWFFPGGGLDSGESAEVGLAREIMEELGCTASIIEPLFARAIQHLHSASEDRHFEIRATYHAVVVEPFRTVHGEHKGEWVAIPRASSILDRDADRWALQTYLRR